MKSWAEVVDQMRTGMQKLTADQKASYAAMLGGQEAMSGLLAIVNASDADYQKLTEAINNSSGAAQRMAEIRIDNLAGDVTLLKSAAEGAGIAMYEGLVDPAREAVQGLTEGVNAFTEKPVPGGPGTDGPHGPQRAEGVRRERCQGPLSLWWRRGVDGRPSPGDHWDPGRDHFRHGSV